MRGSNAGWRLWFQQRSSFEPERSSEFPVCNSEHWNIQKVKRVMDSDADRFRQFAAECRRLAQRVSEKDKAILMEIAGAWIACAEEAERKAQSATNNK